MVHTQILTFFRFFLERTKRKKNITKASQPQSILDQHVLLFVENIIYITACTINRCWKVKVQFAHRRPFNPPFSLALHVANNIFIFVYTHHNISLMPYPHTHVNKECQQIHCYEKIFIVCKLKINSGFFSSYFCFIFYFYFWFCYWSTTSNFLI